MQSIEKIALKSPKTNEGRGEIADPTGGIKKTPAEMAPPPH